MSAIPALEQPPIALALCGQEDAVRKLERQMAELPQVDLGTTHVVHAGLYARTIVIPAGTVLTGALTNCENLCVISGDISVSTDEGLQRLTGYHVLPARAGFKRAGWAHADTHWTTVVATELTDIEAIERMATDEADLLQTRRTGLEFKKTTLEGE